MSRDPSRHFAQAHPEEPPPFARLWARARAKTREKAGRPRRASLVPAAAAAAILIAIVAAVVPRQDHAALERLAAIERWTAPTDSFYPRDAAWTSPTDPFLEVKP